MIYVLFNGFPGKPTEVPKATEEETSATSIHISWHKPSSEGASSIRGYKICYTRDAGDDKETCVTTNSTFKVISDLMPNTQYIISVVAMNDQGDSEKKNNIIVFTLGPSESYCRSDCVW